MNRSRQRQRQRQRGVALIITLIMLAIITVVTLIFLGIARRNRAGISLSSNQTAAEFATEAAFQRAKAEMVAQIMQGGTMMAYDLTVSQGYDVYTNPASAGTSGWGVGNVLPLRDPVGGLDGPVIVSTRNGNDPRFFLDLNRDSAFQVTTTNRVGDPQWVFILDRPDQPYGRNNPAIARYAYIVLPAGKALDVNVNHNTNAPMPDFPGAGRFFRNEGSGPWEINLAALLHESNPGVWTYNAFSISPITVNGTAFADADTLAEYRYGVQDGVRLLSDTVFSAQQTLGTAAIALETDGLDEYSDGGSAGNGSDNDRSISPWSGSRPIRHYFTHQDFFDPAKTTPQFTTNLIRAINDPSDAEAPFRYYQLLSQLATDSGIEPVGDKINLNWVDRGIYTVTNFASWDSNLVTSVTFLTNVAERLFRQQFNDFNGNPFLLPITNITTVPVAPVSLYSPAIHRIFQLAANTLEATRADPFPLVFLPQFRVLGTNVFLNGFVEDHTPTGVDTWTRTNVYGIPALIGAKKCLPNFNEYTLRTDVLATRKLQLTRPDANPDTRPNGTNQMYMIGISNLFAAEGWNSCNDEYRRPTTIIARNSVEVRMTNYSGSIPVPTNSFTFAVQFRTGTQSNRWFGRGIDNAGGFILPLNHSQVLVPNSAFRFGSRTFDPVGTNIFELGSGFRIPQLVLTVSNRFSYYAVDETEGRVFDIALLNDSSFVDITAELLSGNAYQGTAVSGPMIAVWRTNLVRNVPDGVRQQVSISLGNTPTSLSDWNSFSLQQGSGQDKEKAIDAFRAFNGLSPLFTTNITNSALSMQAPFSPAAKLSKITTWQANDPLVHYHPGDLYVTPTNSNTQRIVPPNTSVISNVEPATLGFLNDRYSPWGGNPNKQSALDANSFDLSMMDPCVYSSDDWSFPSNKLASVGWLGRVHRGTPWQSVYFKSEIADMNRWVQIGNDFRTHPTNDWRLADIFTTALTETMTKGLLSINNTNVGAWSAVLSGVVVFSNTLAQPVLFDPRAYQEVFIEPAGARNTTFDPPLMQIWSAIQQAREAQPTKTFTNLSQLLAIHALTTDSPYLDRVTDTQRQFGIDDFAYERIPQQILGLLRLGQPRFVIYAYGQALKPERINPSTGVVENYQVTAEHATRTVLRVEGTPQNPRTVIETFNILPPD